jgi:glutamine amidotransferase
MVTIVDSGICNLGSISRALERAGGTVGVATSDEQIAAADKLVLPGVGSFPAGMAALNERGLADAILQHAAAGKPLLGVCLGMQLLFETGTEYGETRGLGLIPGRVRELQSGANPLPHMGWNRIECKQADPLFEDMPEEAYFYFVHSFVCEPADADDVIGETEYGERFCSVVRRGKLWGIQAHPEKSQRCGAKVLENFLKQ